MTVATSTPITIANLRPVGDGSGNFKGTFSVIITGKAGSIELHECRLIQQPGKAWFWCGAQRTYEKDGQKKYISLFKVSKELEAKISAVLLPQVKHLLESPAPVDNGTEEWI